MRLLLALCLALAGCSDGDSAAGGQAQAPQDLEKAAIERGLVRDPAESEVAGLYARDTDRLCIVRNGGEYRAGAFVDYGDGITCSGAGTMTRAGSTLRFAFGSGADECSFAARFDGDKVSFPGAVPDACAKLCSRRASFAGLEVSRLSESAAEALAMRDAAGKQLCGD